MGSRYDMSPDLSSFCRSADSYVREMVADGSVTVKWSAAFEVVRLTDGVVIFHVAGYSEPMYSADGSKIFALSGDGTTMASFGATDGSPLRSIALDLTVSTTRRDGWCFAETARGRFVMYDYFKLFVEGRRVAWNDAGNILGCSGDIVMCTTTVMGNPGVRFIDMESGATVWATFYPMLEVTISGDGRAIFAYSDAKVDVHRSGVTRTLLTPAIAHRRLVVSRDGTKMVELSARGASLIDVESGATEWTVSDSPYTARFSGDGSRVIFVGLEDGLYIYDATTSIERIRTALESGSGRSIPTELGESIRRFVS